MKNVASNASPLMSMIKEVVSKKRNVRYYLLAYQILYTKISYRNKNITVYKEPTLQMNTDEMSDTVSSTQKYHTEPTLQMNPDTATQADPCEHGVWGFLPILNPMCTVYHQRETGKHCSA